MTIRPIGKLPADAEEELKQAALEPEPKLRLRLIDKANERARQRYPQLFRNSQMPNLQIQNVRLAFGDAIWEMKAFAGDADSKPAYSNKFIIDPKDTATVKALDKAMKDAAIAKWNEKGEGILAKLIKDGKVCFVKGEYENKNGEVYDGFEGMYYLSCRGQVKPTTVDRNRNRVTKEDGVIYSGCYVNAMIDIYAQDNGFGRRINCSLTGIQFNRKGDAFGGGAPADPNAFADLGDSEDDLETSDLD